MHRITIVQNKNQGFSKDYLFLPFFCLVNIYRLSLRKVGLGRPNPKLLQPLNLYLRKKRKKIHLLRIVCTTMYRSPILNFDFDLFKKKKNMFKKTCQFFLLYI